LSPDSKFAATFGLSKGFEARELKSGAVQSLLWQAPITKSGLGQNQPVSFAHEGFAVAGAAGDSQVYVWDGERGDRLLSLNHGGEFPRFDKDNFNFN